MGQLAHLVKSLHQTTILVLSIAEPKSEVYNILTQLWSRVCSTYSQRKLQYEALIWWLNVRKSVESSWIILSMSKASVKHPIQALTTRTHYWIVNSCLYCLCCLCCLCCLLPLLSIVSIVSIVWYPWSIVSIVYFLHCLLSPLSCLLYIDFCFNFYNLTNKCFNTNHTGLPGS